MAGGGNPVPTGALLNFRVFTTEDDLRDALVAAVQLAASGALSPYVGIVGEPGEARWILDSVGGAVRLAMVGYPAGLNEEIRARDDLDSAHPADLREPLDVVVALGGPPDAMPPWFGEARGILIAPGTVEAAVSWSGRTDAAASGSWTFLVENVWQSMSTEGAR